MNPFEFSRKLAKITEPVIKKLSIEAVLDNEDVILNDSIEANLSGLTFNRNDIGERAPFSDWHETGEFHETLGFYNDKDINFDARGEGWNAIRQAFKPIDWQAPRARTLDEETLNKIQVSLIEKIGL